MREGRRDEGRTQMESASAQLAADGDACVQLRGCEPQRFMAAYNNLLALRSAELAGAAEGFAEIEPLENDSPLQPLDMRARGNHKAWRLMVIEPKAIGHG